MEIYCSHAAKITHRKYFNRCSMCGAEWYTKDPVPLVVIGHTNVDDVIVNNVHHTEIEKPKFNRKERDMNWIKRMLNRIRWATMGNQVSYAEANVYVCQFCDKNFSKSFFKDICSACVRKSIIKGLQ